MSVSSRYQIHKYKWTYLTACNFCSCNFKLKIKTVILEDKTQTYVVT